MSPAQTADSITTRFPEARIKEAILHPDPGLRDLAIRYFAKAYSPDPSRMPLVIQSVGDPGNKEAVDALTRIGTPAVVEAVAQAFPTADRSIRHFPPSHWRPSTPTWACRSAWTCSNRRRTG